VELSCIAFPLRFEGGLLRRSSEPEAIVALVESMARTPGGSWAGSSAFGLRDLLEDARQRPTVVPTMVAKLNLALTELGITSYRVEAMDREPSVSHGVESYALALVPAVGGQGHTFNLQF
jgi:hypothetical protein